MIRSDMRKDEPGRSRWPCNRNACVNNRPEKFRVNYYDGFRLAFARPFSTISNVNYMHVDTRETSRWPAASRALREETGAPQLLIA